MSTRAASDTQKEALSTLQRGIEAALRRAARKARERARQIRPQEDQTPATCKTALYHAKDQDR